ncbi:hypothetical protein, unlikely [Trypanosoma brucei gambiense DAL972]|uniref:Uncharacterized protein n=1 Tax=Trypanosoma brucei gambiense (strain MHOM/CI/86/DAL972) TaxID=679716 RepID=C9ZTG8_TRYB9|nr:hypothetical protein, unlikely [Trypanosoma brucei gambiense DAL972]CBH12703.1 hypothetical protein, unlikely [Trypanosoma brucei gambiense DAL972]|eukprot:XP_011774983.1 hypothetical protein, unlikely [Trypanosoma brucei gambiense DAL972]
MLMSNRQKEENKDAKSCHNCNIYIHIHIYNNTITNINVSSSSNNNNNNDSLHPWQTFSQQGTYTETFQTISLSHADKQPGSKKKKMLLLPCHADIHASVSYVHVHSLSAPSPLPFLCFFFCFPAFHSP